METVKEILEVIGSFLLAMKINPMYVLLFVAAGYIQSAYFAWFHRLNEAWKTLVLGTVFSVVYAILLRNVTDKSTWVEFAASYIFATSMYELFLKDLVNKIILFIKNFYGKKLEG